MKNNMITPLLMVLLLAGCDSPTPSDAIYNKVASIDAADSLTENPLQWPVITLLINRSDSTMATLYGNNSAVAYARQQADGNYPAGAKLALVTWQQQTDPHWFGGNMPGKIVAVEMIEFDAMQRPQYTFYQGQPLRKHPAEHPERVATLLAYRAAVVPH